jgi:hypothetical protein
VTFDHIRPETEAPPADQQESAEATEQPGVTSGRVPDASKSKEPKEPKDSAATLLVKLAERRYQLGCTPDGEPFAIPHQPPHIVRLLRGGRGSLRAELAQAFYAETGHAPSQSALADACGVIEGKAAQTEPEELHLRVAGGDGTYVLDLGDQSGRAVVITRTGWQVVNEPPVLFKRTALTGALPEPARGGTLQGDLWPLLNVRDTYRPILAAVLVAALMPHVPHPILSLAGEQGSGKSTAARIISAILDSSPAQLRKSPRDLDTWTTAAAGSWVVALDNVSTIPEWLSDALCRASTGDGDVRRRLYSDGDLHVIAFRRVVVLNGIDLGAVRDDLADRLVTVHLDRITDRGRRLDADVARRWQRAHPRVLGAVLDLTVRVLAELPSVKLDELPRMADFAYVLAAVDQVLGTTGFTTYLGLRDELAEDALNSDPVLGAISRAIAEEWTGTAADLLSEITPGDADWRPPKDWPRTPIAMRGVLKRRAPSLRRLGWTVEDAPDDAHSKVKRTRLIPPPREGGNGTRNPRNPRGEEVPAGQGMDDSAGVTAGVAGIDTRNPENTRTDTRNPGPAVTSENAAAAGVAGVAGTKPALSLSAHDAHALRLVTDRFDVTLLDATGTEDPR